MIGPPPHWYSMRGATPVAMIDVVGGSGGLALYWLFCPVRLSQTVYVNPGWLSAFAGEAKARSTAGRATRALRFIYA